MCLTPLKPRGVFHRLQRMNSGKNKLYFWNGCGHSFHHKCIQPWLADPGQKPCPTCRRPQHGVETPYVQPNTPAWDASQPLPPDTLQYTEAETRSHPAPCLSENDEFEWEEQAHLFEIPRNQYHRSSNSHASSKTLHSDEGEWQYYDYLLSDPGNRGYYSSHPGLPGRTVVTNAIEHVRHYASNNGPQTSSGHPAAGSQFQLPAAIANAAEHTRNIAAYAAENVRNAAAYATENVRNAAGNARSYSSNHGPSRPGRQFQLPGSTGVLNAAVNARNAAAQGAENARNAIANALPYSSNHGPQTYSSGPRQQFQYAVENVPPRILGAAQVPTISQLLNQISENLSYSPSREDVEVILYDPQVGRVQQPHWIHGLLWPFDQAVPEVRL